MIKLQSGTSEKQLQPRGQFLHLFGFWTEEDRLHFYTILDFNPCNIIRPVLVKLHYTFFVG